MRTLEFVVHSIDELTNELVSFNLSGCIWIDYDDNCNEIIEIKNNFIECWLSALGNKNGTVHNNSPIKSYYIFQGENYSIKPVHYINYQGIYRLNELEAFELCDYYNDENALLIIEDACKFTNYLPQPLLKIVLGKQEQKVNFKITLTDLGKKIGIDINKLDVDNPINATKLVLSNTIYANHKSYCNARQYAVLDVESNVNKQEKQLFITLIKSIFPIEQFEDGFSSHHSFYINLIKNGRLLASLMFCENLMRLPDWSYEIKGVVQDIVTCRKVIYELLKPNEENFYNDLESITVLNYIKSYEREQQLLIEQ